MHNPGNIPLLSSSSFFQEITGVIPIETYLTLHPDEPLPKIKRRVGTTFAIPDDVFANSGTVSFCRKKGKLN